MDRKEFLQGVKVLKATLEGMERILASPEALARMRQRAKDRPEIMLGPTLESMAEASGEPISFEEDFS